MKDKNEPTKVPGGIEPSFFRKPSSRQEGNKLHLECEIEALPRPDIKWYRDQEEVLESPKYQFYRAIQPSNPNIHFVRLTIVNASEGDGGNYVVRAVNEMGDKDCTLALNFGGAPGDEENVPAKIYEQPELKQPDPSILILEAHVQANPKPKITWLCNGDFVKESERKFAKLVEKNSLKDKMSRNERYDFTKKIAIQYSPCAILFKMTGNGNEQKTFTSQNLFNLKSLTEQKQIQPNGLVTLI